jgi:hypothetical protein
MVSTVPRIRARFKLPQLLQPCKYFFHPTDPAIGLCSCANVLKEQSFGHRAVIAVEWSDFDMGNGLYDFAITDNTLQPWINAGKKVNLVLHNTSYGSSFCPGTGVGSNGTVASNCAVPGWMGTALGQ